MAFCCIGYDFLNLFLSVEVRAIRFISAVALACSRIVRVPGEIPHGTYSGQFRIFFNFNTPSLVLRKMEMEYVQFVIGHDVKHALHFVYREEMATHIQHIASVSEPGFIVDVYQWQRICLDLFVLHARHDICRQHFLYGLESIEETSCGFGFNRHFVGCNLEFIAFRIHFYRTGVHLHLEKRIRSSGHHGYFKTGCCREGFRKAHGFAFTGIVQVHNIDLKIPGQIQATFRYRHAFRNWGNVYNVLGLQKSREQQGQHERPFGHFFHDDVFNGLFFIKAGKSSPI